MPVPAAAYQAEHRTEGRPEEMLNGSGVDSPRLSARPKTREFRHGRSRAFFTDPAASIAYSGAVARSK
jgi:hypothetical protein